MARDAGEARQMLDASRNHSSLVTQIVPSPFGLEHHDAISALVADGFLGDLRELAVIGATGAFTDPSQPLHWRQDREISGYNTLTLGILHETATRWAPQPTEVYAQSEIFERDRRTASGETAQASVPDSLQIVTRWGGEGTDLPPGRGLYHMSGAIHFGPDLQIHLYGFRRHHQAGPRRAGRGLDRKGG